MQMKHLEMKIIMSEINGWELWQIRNCKRKYISEIKDTVR